MTGRRFSSLSPVARVVYLARIAACALLWLSAVGCGYVDTSVAPPPLVGPGLPGESRAVLTTARPNLRAALDDFLVRRPEPVQPVEFPHNIHVGKKIACTEYCHEPVTTGPVAGLPSVRTCMICHNAIATDRPRIKLITQMRTEGRDLQWQRVFGYPAPSHVKFNHAPHIRKEIMCETCHGPIGTQTVAQRNVEMTMGFCVNCHQERQAPLECLTCHY